MPLTSRAALGVPGVGDAEAGAAVPQLLAPGLSQLQVVPHGRVKDGRWIGLLAAATTAVVIAVSVCGADPVTGVCVCVFVCVRCVCVCVCV